jgi:hypothetical protein
MIVNRFRRRMEEDHPAHRRGEDRRCGKAWPTVLRSDLNMKNLKGRAGLFASDRFDLKNSDLSAQVNAQ